MARKIKEIEEQIKTEVAEKLNLSTSGVAEWRLWATVIASVIYAFELVMDSFKKEIEERTDKAIPGTLRWYINLCRRWQYDDELLYNADTSELYYETIDKEKQIIDAIAIVEGKNNLTVKTAKLDGDSLTPLSDKEKFSLKVYLDKVKFAGDRITIISTEPDKISYEIDVYTDNLTPQDTLKELVKKALDKYRLSLEFNGTLHTARIVGELLNVESVVTAEVKKLTMTSAGDEITEIVTSTTCTAGYFNFDHEASTITIK